MPVQTYPYLVLTDGTDTVTIQDGLGGQTSYALVSGSWASAIAGLRASALGGRGPYADVPESMLLNIYGATAATAFANLAKLARLLDRATRWARGENVTAVLIKLAPQGSEVSSTASPLQAAVLGRAPGDETAGVALAAHWDQVGQTFVIPNVRLRFLRRGLWLHTAVTASSAATDNGDVATIAPAGGALNVASPTKLSFTNTISPNVTVPRYALLADTASALLVVAAEGGATGNFTSVNDSAAGARNTNVLRYTPADTTTNYCAYITIAPPAGAKRFMLLVNARRSSGTATFTLTGQLGVSTGTVPAASRSVTLTNTSAEWVNLGLVVMGLTPDQVRIAVAADAASGALDIDSLVVVALDTGQVSVIGFPRYDVWASSLADYSLDHRLLTANAPTVTADDVPTIYHGDAVLVSAGATLYVLWLATGKLTGVTWWRQADNAGTLYQNTWTAVRTNAYLAPV